MSVVQHYCEGDWERGKDQDWMTAFHWNLGYSGCAFCSDRLIRLMESRKTRSPGHTVPILITSAGQCCVEFRSVDPNDAMSEWTYWIWIKLTLEERLMYWSAV